MRLAPIATGKHTVLMSKSLDRLAAIQLDRHDLIRETTAAGWVVTDISPAGTIVVAGGDVMSLRFAYAVDLIVGQRSDVSILQSHLHHASGDDAASVRGDRRSTFTAVLFAYNDVLVVITGIKGHIGMA